MSKKITLILFLMFSGLQLQAQLTVTGTVKDVTGTAIPGANIILEGTNQGTVTDTRGNFTLEVPSADETLIVSFLGYESQTININGRTSIDIVLEEDVKQLEEVVVVGYGTERKSDLTGAISSVQVPDNVARQSTSIDQLLQGRAAGVQVTGGGQPGTGVSVRIRGTNSLRGNNEPLYVVDGVIISSAGEDAISASTDANDAQVNQNGLNGINPRDIESIEILKDASATAIYGSRGANGVVLITTKKGLDGDAQVNGYVTTSVTEVTRKLDVLDPIDYAQYQNEAAIINNNDAVYHIENGQVFPIIYGDDGAEISEEPARLVNWQDEILERANDFNAGISMRGGGERGNYYISAGFNSQGGIIESSRFQTGDIRMNITQKLSERIEVQGVFSGYYGEGTFAQDGDRAGGANRSFMNNVVSFNPVITGNDVQDFADEEDLTSPYSFVNDFEDVSVESRFIGKLAFVYDIPIEGLSYELNAGGNIRTKERRRFFGLTTFKGSRTNGELAMSQLTSKSYQINNLLRYKKGFGGGNRINAVIGFTYDNKDVENELYEVQNFATTTFTVDQPFFGQVVSRPLEILYRPTTIISGLGRVNYTLRNKYIFTASFRYDGVSKFQKDNRWSFFPSFAFAWRAGDEPFIQDLNIFDDLKVRAGWGQIGNHGIQPFQTLGNYGGTLYATPGNGTSVAYVPLNIANPDLRWETTEQLNVGIDFGFWDNRITGSIDAYTKYTKDLLQELALPPSSGFGNLSTNRGEISNKGIEFVLNAIIVDNTEFSLSVGGNISFNRTRIENLGIPPSTVYIDGLEQQRSFYLGNNVSSGNYFKAPANVFMEGEPIGMFFGYETDGIWQSSDEVADGFQPGDVRIIDQNNDGVINSLDRTIIGDPNPDFVYGMNIMAQYRRFSLNILLNGQYGNDIANGNLLRFAVAEGNGNNVIAPAYHEAWRPERETNTYPRIGYLGERQASSIPDRIIEDGSFMRIGNITFSYDLPVESIGSIELFQLYIAGRNLFTFTEYTGFDPEVNSFRYDGNIVGVDFGSVPNTRSITLGANITF